MSEAVEKRRQLIVLIVTVLGSTVVLLDGTIVNLALPKIASSLHANFSTLQWITDAYLLSLSALILLGGSLGDIFGRKKIYLIGLVGFGISSLLCALAPSALFLLTARFVQGIFGALLVPGALSIINTNFPTRVRGRAIGQWTGWLSIGTVLGPLVGGLILSIASWRWIFLVNIPLVVVCYILAVPSINETRDNETRHVDVKGASLAALALGGITIGLIEGPVQHWAFGPVLALLAGCLLAVGFVLFEARKKDPLVRLSLFRSRNFSGSNLMTFALYGALSGFIFALVIYLQTTMGYSSLQAGFSLLPVSVLMFFFAGRVGKLSATYGPRRFMTVGPIIVAVGIASLYRLQPGASYITGVLPGALLFSAGMVLTVAPLTITVLASVSEHDSGIASGINNAVSRAAGLIVVAFLGLLGATNFYHFSMALCAGLAFLAGVTSFLIIEKVPVARNEPATK